MIAAEPRVTLEAPAGAPVPNALGGRVEALRVGFQGEPGAYGSAAIELRWNGDATPVGAPTFARVIGLLLERSVDVAVLPVWNSTIGDVRAAQEPLYESGPRLEVVDEILLPVRHALLARPGASLATLRAVGSHPVALAQCTRFFAERPAIGACDAADTAGAARELAAFDLAATDAWYAAVPNATSESLGVIASEAAAARYGLTVLLTDVQDQSDNATRFVVVRRRGAGRW